MHLVRCTMMALIVALATIKVFGAEAGVAKCSVQDTRTGRTHPILQGGVDAAISPSDPDDPPTTRTCM